MNDHILKWGPFLDSAIRKWAKKCPREYREDLKQECFLQIMQDQKLEPAIKELEGPEAVEKYMAATARNIVVDLYRSTPEEHVEWVPLESVDQYKKVEMDTGFMEMLSVLTPEERSVITMVYRERTPKADIARQYGRPPHWVYQVLNRAIKKLRAQEGIGANTDAKNLSRA